MSVDLFSTNNFTELRVNHYIYHILSIFVSEYIHRSRIITDVQLGSKYASVPYMTGLAHKKIHKKATNNN